TTVITEPHQHDILHRDLKTANMMVTEGGIVKILDFGLARRHGTTASKSTTDGTQDNNTEQLKSERFGTTAYMAPEQFDTLRSSKQSDLFSLGVILYETFTGQHPFLSLQQNRQDMLVHTIRTRKPTAPVILREEIPAELDKLIMKAIEKQPSNRFKSVSELKEALKLTMKSMEFEQGLIPGEMSATLPSPSPKQTSSGKKDKRKGLGMLSKISNLFQKDDASTVPENSIAVLPFKQIEGNDRNRYFGLALADAVATRLSQNASVAIRPPSTFLSLSDHAIGEIEAGQKLQTEYVLTGSFFSAEEGFSLNWQLVEIDSQTIRAGSSIAVPSLDLVKVQSEI